MPALFSQPVDVLVRPQSRKSQHCVSCPVCQHHEFHVLLTPFDLHEEQEWLEQFYKERLNGADGSDRVSFTQDDDTNIAACANCNTLFRNPRPSTDLLKSRYANDHYTPETLQNLAHNQDAFFRRKVRRIRHHLPPGANVLEIGSFTGSFLLAARSAGWYATGVDIGAETTTFMRNRGLTVLQGDLAELRLPPRTFDAVFIWNTFDQLPQPLTTLRLIHTVLRENGLIYLRVPNGLFKTTCLKLLKLYPNDPTSEYVRRAQAYNNFMTFPYLVGYTPDSLSRQLYQNGFIVSSLTGDTLVRLSDANTPRRYALEEQRYKSAVTERCAMAAKATGTNYFPWIDMLAKKISSNCAGRLPRAKEKVWSPFQSSELFRFQTPPSH